MTIKRMVRPHPLVDGVDHFDVLAGIGPGSYGGGRPLPDSQPSMNETVTVRTIHSADGWFIWRRRARLACELPSAARVLAR